MYPNHSGMGTSEYKHRNTDSIVTNDLPSYATKFEQGMRFGGHDQERGHTSVNRSCVLALWSVIYFDVWSDLRPDYNRESQSVKLWSKMGDLVNK